MIARILAPLILTTIFAASAQAAEALDIKETLEGIWIEGRVPGLVAVFATSYFLFGLVLNPLARLSLAGTRVMRRAHSLASACALTLTAMAAFAFSAGAAPQDSTLDAQIEHGLSGCESASPDKTAVGFIPPGFDYRFTATSTADAHPIGEAHRRFAVYWEKSFRRPAVPGTDVGELKRELRLTGSKASAWLLGAESQIDEFLRAYKPGKPVTYEVALLGCTGSSGSYDAIMALKEFEVESD